MVTLADPEEIDPAAGVSLTLGNPAAVLSNTTVKELLRYDSTNQLLFAIHPLTRADRATLLNLILDVSIQSAVETLYALGKLTFTYQAGTLTGTLTCRGLLPSSSAEALKQSVGDDAFTSAIDVIKSQQYEFLERKLRYCELAQYEFPWSNTTPLSVPTELEPYIYIDTLRNKLIARGQPTDEEIATLTSPPSVLTASSLDSNQVNDVPDLFSASEINTYFGVNTFQQPPIDPSIPTTTAELSATLLQKLMPYASELLKHKTIVTALSNSLGLTNSITKYVVENLPSATTAPSIASAFALLDIADAPNDPAYEKDYRRLSKIALLLQRLNIQDIHLAWLFDYATGNATGSWLSVPSLQVDAVSSDVNLQKLTELIQLIAIAGKSPYPTELTDQILQKAATETNIGPILSFLGDNSQWLAEDLETICQSLAISHPIDCLKAQNFERIYDAMTDLARLGANADKALALTQPNVDDGTAAIAKSLAKSKHTADDWLAIVETINNVLREARRSALVDYLVTYPRRDAGTKDPAPLWHDVDTLYEYLLVDVQMSACMKTSRIRLALNSVQLFVQRCLMNLEPDVTVSDNEDVRRGWDEWDKWRRLYRVWEANRKVFLYPEDWMDPTLRDDKTSFFEELENELLQGDVTSDSAETALLNYLHKLDQVSKLEVMGIFEDIRVGTLTSPYVQVLHVVARTYGEPHDWFYRTLTTPSDDWNEGTWSPWEKIDADVEGDHVLPVVWNEHLFLFWPLFSTKADKATKDELNDKQNTHDSKNRWYIKFAWSERKNGKWSPKRVSKEPLRTECVESGDTSFVATDFSFKTDVSRDGITIKCYGPIVTEESSQGLAADNKNVPASGTQTEYLYTGPSNIVIGFLYSSNGPWRDNIDIVVDVLRDGVTESLSYTNSDAIYSSKDHQYWLFAAFNNTSSTDYTWWQNATINVRTAKPVFAIPLGSQTQTDPYKKGDAYNEWDWVVTNTEGTQTPSPTQTETDAGGGTESAQVSRMTRFGRFDYQVCRSDLQPTSEVVIDETLPDLTDGVSLQGMMYVATQTQPYLNDVLGTPVTPYRVLLPHQYSGLITSGPHFLQNDQAVFFVSRYIGFWFNVFYHPFTCDFIATAAREGVGELLTLESQSADDGGANFANYHPDAAQVQIDEVNYDGSPVLDLDGKPVPVTREYVDFSSSGSYSIYNWELFFHIPWLIATKLMANQRFEEARKWFHYIFDPTTRPGVFKPTQDPNSTQRFWNVMPFWEGEGKEILSIDDLLRGAADLTDAFTEWRQDPFQPFVVARARQSAFMRAVVMNYIDNLIQWGDQLFAQFTDESTNEATLLYVLASQILGRAPEKVPPRVRGTLQTYQSLLEHAALEGTSPDITWEDFSDVMVEIEAFIPPSAAVAQPDISSQLGRMWAFCVPPNDNLLKYWPRVAQQLFNLRHFSDIEGVEQQFPLLDPPINTVVMVRSPHAGTELASVLGDINAATPHYRFNVMSQKAIEFCNELKNFGAALLSTLEKKDAEGLSLLKATQDVTLFNAIRAVKEKQLQQSTAQHDAAEKSKVTVQARLDHYQSLAKMNGWEIAATTLSSLAISQEIGAGVADALGAIAAIIPQYQAGTSGFYSSPVVTAIVGGEQISRAASATASAARTSAAILTALASGSQTLGSYDRRQEEWTLQETLAKKELDQIDKQILAAEIQETIAQIELDNHKTQIDNAQATEEYLKGKYTNKELYGWMLGQLSSLYFQAYKLAFDMAKKAERAFCHELGLTEAKFIQFGYWDSLRKGLMAGEKLQSDLRRMEAAYLDQNVRELEITKHVSLLALNPIALVLLRATGKCEVDIPEWLFDMDYPGHFMRRIKSVALSIPCVVGPYTSVNCTLTQLFSKVRLPDSDLAKDYTDSSKFHENFGSAEAIVTSHAREDSGLFEVNFRDERYLPFEGSGAISRWRIELPLDSNQFDLNTVSDVVLHLRYTARNGGDDLRDAAMNALPKKFTRMFSLKQEFPSEWYQLTTSVDGDATTTSTQLTMSRNRFPFVRATTSVSIGNVSLYALPTVAASEAATDVVFPQYLNLYLPPNGVPGDLSKVPDVSIGRLPGKVITNQNQTISLDDDALWKLEIAAPKDQNLNDFEENISDILVVCDCTITEAP